MTRAMALQRAVPDPVTGSREALGIEPTTKRLFISVRSMSDDEFTRILSGTMAEEVGLLPTDVPLNPPGVLWKPVRFVA